MRFRRGQRQRPGPGGQRPGRERQRPGRECQRPGGSQLGRGGTLPVGIRLSGCHRGRRHRG